MYYIEIFLLNFFVFVYERERGCKFEIFLVARIFFLSLRTQTLNLSRFLHLKYFIDAKYLCFFLYAANFSKK